MKATGIVRRVDRLGRVVIPKEIRKVLRIDEGDPLEIFTEKDEIVLKRYSPVKSTEETAGKVVKSLNYETGFTALICDKNEIIAVKGENEKDITGLSVSKDVAKLIKDKRNVLVSYQNGGMPIAIVEGNTFGFINQAFIPFYYEGEATGAVILMNKEKEKTIRETELNLLRFASDMLSDNGVS